MAVIKRKHYLLNKEQVLISIKDLDAIDNRNLNL